MNEELLPCPFCGGKAELVPNAGYDCPGYIVICADCDAQTGVSPFIAPEYAIAAWNRRAQPAWEPVAEGERLLVRPPLSKEGVGIICRRFAPTWWDGEELTKVEVRWAEDDEWQNTILFLPQNYWLCRRVGE